MSGVSGDKSKPDEMKGNKPVAKDKITKNIVIFGETGAGKSSLINLLTGKYSAEVGTGAKACTRFPKDYTIPGVNEDEAYNLFDTGGFSEGNKGILAYGDAKKAMEYLIDQLSKPDENGVGLLVFVLRDGRPLSDSAVRCYRDFKAYCANKVPILLVMTHFDVVADADLQISKKMVTFTEKGMRFDSTIAGCAADLDLEYPKGQKEYIIGRRDTTRKQILQQLKIHTGGPGWKKIGFFGAFMQLFSA